MANISKITLPDNVTYDIKDANALQKTENAVSASRLVTKYQISGTAGWYHFLDVPSSANNRSITLLIDQGASHYSGILKIYLGGASVYFVEWLATTYPIDQVRWIYNNDMMSLYIYKSTSYTMGFTVLSAFNRVGTELTDITLSWDNTFISTAESGLPTGVTAATGEISNQSLTTERLGLQHYIYGATGWYKFFEVDMEDIATQAGTQAVTLNLNLLVQDTYGYIDGILNLCFNINTSHNFVGQNRVNWLSLYQSSSFSLDDVVYTIDDTTHKATIYFNKRSTDSQGMIIFYIINQYSRRSTPDISSCWKRESVASIPENARISTGPTAEYDIEGNKIDSTYLKTANGLTEYYGVCDTAAATQAKTVSISGIDELIEGMQINVKFNYSQDYNGTPTLNVNSLGAKSIYRSASRAAVQKEWHAGSILELVYDGTYWIIVNHSHASTTYYGQTLLTDSTSSTSTTTAATPNSVKQTYDLANSKAPQLSGVYSGSCTTAAATQAKTVSIPEITAYFSELKICIYFVNAQNYDGQPTLNINNLGARPIYRTLDSSMPAILYEWSANTHVLMSYSTSLGGWIIIRGNHAGQYYGLVKLDSSGSVRSTYTDRATTPAAVKTAYDTANSARQKSATISLPLSWSGSYPYQQTVTISGQTITANSKISLQPTATQLDQLLTWGVSAITIENNNGTLIAYALGNVPQQAMIINCTVTEVTS